MKPKDQAVAGVAAQFRRAEEVHAQALSRFAEAREKRHAARVSGIGLGEVRSRIVQRAVSERTARAPAVRSDLPTPSEDRLKHMFELTSAEARLAQLLATGDSLEEVSQKLAVKMTTARTQLAAIFAKTETRRQAKLVAVLSRVAHLEEQARLGNPEVASAKQVSFFTDNGPAGMDCRD